MFAMFAMLAHRSTRSALAAVLLPFAAAAAQAGAVMRASPGQAEAAYVNLTAEQTRAFIAAHHPAIAAGTSDDDMVTLIVDLNGNYITSASSKAPTTVSPAVANAVTAATRLLDSTQAVAATPRLTAVAGALATIAPTQADGQPRMVAFDGIGSVDARLIRAMSVHNYAAGDVSANAVRVRVVALSANSIR